MFWKLNADLQSCLNNNNDDEVTISNNCWIVILLRIYNLFRLYFYLSFLPFFFAIFLAFFSFSFFLKKNLFLCLLYFLKSDLFCFVLIMLLVTIWHIISFWCSVTWFIICMYFFQAKCWFGLFWLLTDELFSPSSALETDFYFQSSKFNSWRRQQKCLPFQVF